MKRIMNTPRPNWQAIVAEQGLTWGTLDDGSNYWNESAYYSFTPAEIDQIKTATKSLYNCFIEAGDYIINKKLLSAFHIPENFHGMINLAWKNEPPALNYGRFDFGFDGTNLKMFEFNCDTPTSLLESAYIQWQWSNGRPQFNEIADHLIAKWQDILTVLPTREVHFTSAHGDKAEDFITCGYMADLASDAGVFPRPVMINDIGWDNDNCYFVDGQNQPIDVLYHLYPWEWLTVEEFGKHILDTDEMFWIEPIWKMIWSNKVILAVLHELFPNHPNILPADIVPPTKYTNYVRKPILGREGSNVTIIKENAVISKTNGVYSDGPFIYQQRLTLPEFDGNYPIIGSWIVDGEPCGIGVRESKTLITDNKSSFVPHLIEGEN